MNLTEVALIEKEAFEQPKSQFQRNQEWIPTSSSNWEGNISEAMDFPQIRKEYLVYSRTNDELPLLPLNVVKPLSEEREFER